MNTFTILIQTIIYHSLSQPGLHFLNFANWFFYNLDLFSSSFNPCDFHSSCSHFLSSFNHISLPISPSHPTISIFLSIPVYFFSYRCLSLIFNSPICSDQYPPFHSTPYHYFLPINSCSTTSINHFTSLYILYHPFLFFLLLRLLYSSFSFFCDHIFILSLLIVSLLILYDLQCSFSSSSSSFLLK